MRLREPSTFNDDNRTDNLRTRNPNCRIRKSHKRKIQNADSRAPGDIFIPPMWLSPISAEPDIAIASQPGGGLSCASSPLSYPVAHGTTVWYACGRRLTGHESGHSQPPFESTWQPFLIASASAGVSLQEQALAWADRVQALRPWNEQRFSVRRAV